MKYILAYDLGTGGLKTSLFDENGKSLGYCFLEIDTFFPQRCFHTFGNDTADKRLLYGENIECHIYFHFHIISSSGIHP